MERALEVEPKERAMQANPSAIDEKFRPFAARMAQAGMDQVVIETFRFYYTSLVEGATGLIPEQEITPAEDLPDAEMLQGYENPGREALSRTVIIKLNGGLGTSMGLAGPKSLLVAREGYTFLDIIARQTLALRGRTGTRAPLILMNSFSTREASLAALQKYPDLDVGLPLDFLQNMAPKVLQENHAPPEEESELGWCPPGHGDLYVALQSSGLLRQMLDAGYEFAFVSNSDNLGAVLDETILGYFAEQGAPFLMEVADRTPADSKGGHIARLQDGRLTLREVAQCPEADLPHFQNTDRHRYFNTNNIWLHLPTLFRTLEAHGGILKLPLIRNSKTLDPRDPSSPAVFQLETAMGAAISVFEGAAAIRTPRTRFAPVKLCSDLLTLWSDAFLLTDDFRVVPNPENPFGLPVVSLDSRYYKLIDQLEERFPAGAPSLKQCQQLKVEGDIRFGRNITVRGCARVHAEQGQRAVQDGAVLSGDLEL